MSDVFSSPDSYTSSMNPCGWGPRIAQRFRGFDDAIPAITSGHEEVAEFVCEEE